MEKKKKTFLVEFSLSTEAAHNCCFWNKGQNISGCKSTDAASQYPHYSTLLSQCARKKILVCVSTSRIGILVCWNFQAVCWDFFVYFSADSHPQSSAHLTIYISPTVGPTMHSIQISKWWDVNLTLFCTQNWPKWMHTACSWKLEVNGESFLSSENSLNVSPLKVPHAIRFH